MNEKQQFKRTSRSFYLEREALEIIGDLSKLTGRSRSAILNKMVWEHARPMLEKAKRQKLKELQEELQEKEKEELKEEMKERIARGKE